MGDKKNSLNQKWHSFKKTTNFRNGMLFLVFVVVSALFWFILALNDNAQDSFNVSLEITNKPDSAVFINNIPSRIHVGVHDKGSNLWRSAVLNKPVIRLDFNDFASDGVFRVTKADLISALKVAFGPSAQIISSSIDSLKVSYTTNQPKTVPVLTDAQIFPASGFTIVGEPTVIPPTVSIYGEQDIIDTINYLMTNKIELKNISEQKSVKVKIKPVRHVKIVPEEVIVDIPIEPLVKKDALITISPHNVPKDESILLFPSKIPVTYYVAMSRLNDNDDPEIELIVDYRLTVNNSDKLPVEIYKVPDRFKNLKLNIDSVEYAIVR